MALTNACGGAKNEHGVQKSSLDLSSVFEKMWKHNLPQIRQEFTARTSRLFHIQLRDKSRKWSLLNLNVINGMTVKLQAKRIWSKVSLKFIKCQLCDSGAVDKLSVLATRIICISLYTGEQWNFCLLPFGEKFSMARSKLQPMLIPVNGLLVSQNVIQNRRFA